MFTFDTIRDIEICQHKNGYRFSIDALLLFSFVNLHRVQKIIDLGAGSGIIGILLAKKYLEADVTLIELQEGLSSLSHRNIASNELNDRVRIINADIKYLLELRNAQAHNQLQFSNEKLKGLFAQFGLAVSNPPFRKLKTGLISCGDEKAIARHEIKLSLSELIMSASFLLRHHGRFCFIHLPERLTEIFVLMRQYSIEPKRLRFVHSRPNSEAKMVLIEGVKGGKPDLKIESPFFIYNDDGSYTQDTRNIYNNYEPKSLDTVKSVL